MASALSSLGANKIEGQYSLGWIRGAHMQEFESIKVLFVAGFGPIVHDRIAGRKLYGETLNISFKEEQGGYLHTEALQGVRSFALWPLDQAAQSCFGKDSWPANTPVPQAWLEFDVDDVEDATAELAGWSDLHAIDAAVMSGPSAGCRCSIITPPRCGPRQALRALGPPSVGR